MVSAGLDPVTYEDKIRESYVWKELEKARNIRPSFHTPLGLYGGLAYTGFIWYLTRGKEPWTFSHGGTLLLHYVPLALRFVCRVLFLVSEENQTVIWMVI